MTEKDNSIPKFMTERKGIWLFLLATLLFAILFVLIYQPAGYMRTGESLMRWNKHLYTVIQFIAGFLILTSSRFLFFHIQRMKNLTRRDNYLWIGGEFIVISLVLSAIAYLLNADRSIGYHQLLERVILNVATILVIPYTASVLILLLRERGHKIKELNEIIDQQQTQSIDSGNENMNFYSQGGKLAFSTKKNNVLYLEAADNYCNIHYMNEGKEDTFILHNSLKNIEESGMYKQLLRCQRGYMVNIDNVKLVKKEKDGLILELSQGGKPIPVSRTYNEKVVQYFIGEVE